MGFCGYAAIAVTLNTWWRYKNLTAVAVVLLGMATAAAANESENGAGLKWLVGFGLTYGGVELAEVELDFDGDSIDEDLRGR